MSPEQKILVQDSFTKIAPLADTAAGLFYQRLFELDPELRSLFPDEMKEQGRKLMTMIGAAVNGLDRLDELVPVVQQLGRRHVTYGVTDEDYDTVGSALIWTLAKGLGEDFTDEVEEAWVAVYTVLADTMKEAATQVA